MTIQAFAERQLLSSPLHLLTAGEIWRAWRESGNGDSLSYPALLEQLRSDGRFVLTEADAPQPGLPRGTDTAQGPFVYLRKQPPSPGGIVQLLESQAQSAYKILLNSWQEMRHGGADPLEDLMIQLLVQVQKIQRNVNQIQERLQSLQHTDFPEQKSSKSRGNDATADAHQGQSGLGRPPA